MMLPKSSCLAFLVAFQLILQLCVAWHSPLSPRFHASSQSLFAGTTSRTTNEYNAIKNSEVIAATDGTVKLVGGLWKKDEQALLVCFRSFG
jgi:hypothetical protein